MDKINPDHYKYGGIETIDYIRAKLTAQQFHGFLAGNVIMYISRHQKKNGVEDLQKAQWYLNRLINSSGGNSMLDRPFIYVCSPLKGDIERNIRKAIGYSRFVYSKGGIPLAPHTIFTQFLDDGDCEEREAGIEMGVQLLVKCNEMWSFGEKISEGMAAEIAAAKVLGITVKRFNDKCEPLEVKEGNGEDKR